MLSPANFEVGGGKKLEQGVGESRREERCRRTASPTVTGEVNQEKRYGASTRETGE